MTRTSLHNFSPGDRVDYDQNTGTVLRIVERIEVSWDNGYVSQVSPFDLLMEGEYDYDND